MAVWWDGDLLRELLNKNVVSKYDWEAGVCKSLVTFEGAVSNNGTKATPCLQGDILGDWREEVLLTVSILSWKIRFIGSVLLHKT